MRVILFLIMTLNICFANDNLTIVAVGEAEREKDKLMFFETKQEEALSSNQKKILNEMFQLFEEDFDFYRHIFEVVKKEKLPTSDKINFDQVKEKGLRYFVTSRVYKNENTLYGEFLLYDAVSKEELLKINRPIFFKNIRRMGHEIADSIYYKITGEKSIFTTKIIFVSDRTSTKSDVRKELYIMDFDGKRKQRLTYNNSMIISPSISPDNSKVIYSVIEGKWKKSSRGKMHKVKNVNLYMYDIHKRKTKLISNLDGINSGAIFTADGKSIYYTLSHQKNADIYKMNLESGYKTRVTNHYSDDVDPHINEDGTLMTFLSGRSGRAMIYTMDPRSLEKNVKRISYVGRFNAAPRFSPDGKEIVFSSWVDNLFDLYKIDSNGRNLVRLTKNFGSNEEAWFSPDGQFIVFTSQKVISRKKALQEIYIMNKEGEILKRLTNRFGKNFTPRWSNFL